jgi:hypothetical protein
MKQIVSVAALGLLLLGSCKKTIEKMKENAVINAMTDGQWVITSFVNNGTVITSDFSGYKFQYHSNYTVDAIKNGTIEKTGTWDGDAATMTITANFPNATTPLSLIDGAWHIDDNSWTYVVASLNTAGGSRTLRLEKL